MTAMDNPAFQDIKRQTRISKDHKIEYTAKIRENWPGHITNWEIMELEEHYLAHVAMVSQWYTFEEASKIVSQIAKRCIKRSCGGRASTRIIIGRNWQNIQKMNRQEALALSSKSRISAGEFRKLTCHIELALGKMSKNNNANDNTHNDTVGDDNDNNCDNNNNDGNKNDNEGNNNDDNGNDNDDADGHDASDSMGNSSKSRAYPAR